MSNSPKPPPPPAGASGGTDVHGFSSKSEPPGAAAACDPSLMMSASGASHVGAALATDPSSGAERAGARARRSRRRRTPGGATPPDLPPRAAGIDIGPLPWTDGSAFATDGSALATDGNAFATDGSASRHRRERARHRRQRARHRGKRARDGRKVVRDHRQIDLSEAERVPEGGRRGGSASRGRGRREALRRRESDRRRGESDLRRRGQPDVRRRGQADVRRRREIVARQRGELRFILIERERLVRRGTLRDRGGWLLGRGDRRGRSLEQVREIGLAVGGRAGGAGQTEIEVVLRWRGRRWRRVSANLRDAGTGHPDHRPGSHALLDDGTGAGAHRRREVTRRRREIDVPRHERHGQALPAGGRSYLRWRGAPEEASPPTRPGLRGTIRGATGAGTRGGRRSCGCWALHDEGVPALGAAHLQPSRGDTPLVDLVGRLAGLALDFQHSRTSPTIKARVTHGIAQVPNALRRFASPASPQNRPLYAQCVTPPTLPFAPVGARTRVFACGRSRVQCFHVEHVKGCDGVVRARGAAWSTLRCAWGWRVRSAAVLPLHAPSMSIPPSSGAPGAKAPIDSQNARSTRRGTQESARERPGRPHGGRGHRGEIPGRANPRYRRNGRRRLRDSRGPRRAGRREVSPPAGARCSTRRGGPVRPRGKGRDQDPERARRPRARLGEDSVRNAVHRHGVSRRPRPARRARGRRPAPGADRRRLPPAGVRRRRVRPRARHHPPRPANPGTSSSRAAASRHAAREGMLDFGISARSSPTAPRRARSTLTTPAIFGEPRRSCPPSSSGRPVMSTRAPTSGRSGPSSMPSSPASPRTSGESTADIAVERIIRDPHTSIADGPEPRIPDGPRRRSSHYVSRKGPGARFPGVAELAEALLPFASEGSRASAARLAKQISSRQLGHAPPLQSRLHLPMSPGPRGRGRTLYAHGRCLLGGQAKLESEKPTSKRGLGFLASVVLAAVVVGGSSWPCSCPHGAPVPIARRSAGDRACRLPRLPGSSFPGPRLLRPRERPPRQRARRSDSATTCVGVVPARFRRPLPLPRPPNPRARRPPVLARSRPGVAPPVAASPPSPSPPANPGGLFDDRE